VINSTAKPLSLYDPEQFKKLAKQQVDALKKSSRRIKMTDYGTSQLTTGYEKLGILPVKNFREGHLEDIDKLRDIEFAKLKVKNSGCYGCMTKCGQERRVSDGFYQGAFSEGPEYETIWALGCNLTNTDPASLVAIDSLCDRMGIDTVSTGNVIGFACELYEKGILSNKDFDGMDLTWGNSKNIIKLVEKIGQREGIGKLLGEGTKRASEQIGEEAENYAMHVKGSELPAYEPRAVKGYGLVFATSNVGANHMYGRPREELSENKDRFAEEGKGKDIARAQIGQAIEDSVIQCSFGAATALNSELRCAFLVAATGYQELGDVAYLDNIGERIICLERLFNVREGFSRKDDRLPSRMLTEKLENAGPSTGQRVANLDNMLDEYYDALGYTNHGIPSASTITRLSLEWTKENVKRC
jgi:aldehyde:ferredoxin oxidoreductase